MNTGASTAVETRPPQSMNKWVAFWVASLGSLMATLDAGIVTVAFPSLANTFKTDASTVVWVTLSYFVVGTGLIFTMGWIGDVMGRRRVYSLGILIFMLGMVAAPFSQNIVHLILIRSLQGVGHSMIMSNSLAILTNAFPAKERGKALGLHGAFLSVGLGGGPALGGIIVDTLGWQAVFYTRIPLAMVGLFMAWTYLPKTTTGRSEKLNLDYLGALALFGALAAFLLMINQAGKLGITSPFVLAATAVTAILLPTLFLIERRAIQPIIDLALFKIRQFNIGLALHFSHFLGVGALFFLAPFYLQDGLGYSAAASGLFLTAFFGMRTFLSPISGTLTDRVGYRIPSSLGLAMMAGGLLLLSRLDSGGSWVLIAASMAFAGVGSALTDPANTSSIMGAVAKNRLGGASASVAASRQMALSIGTALAGAIYTVRQQSYLADNLTDPDAPHKAILAGFSLAMAAIAIPIAISVLLALMKRGQVQAEEPAKSPDAASGS